MIEGCKVAPPVEILVSTEVVQQLELLAEQTAQTAIRLEDKLHDFCTIEEDREQTVNKCSREYPIYFSNLRGIMYQIESSLSKINYTIDRCEV